jgi:enoyl-CoA hydratase
MSTDFLKTAVEGPIGWLTIDRPDSRGALNRAMWEAIPGLLRQLAATPEVRAVVIRGTEGYFIAGADITEFHQYRSDPELARKYDEGSKGTLEALADLDVPSIAMIEGPCVGGGSLVAFGCDLRIASESAFLAIPAGRLGLAYPYHGLERLVAVAGESQALDLLLTGRRVGGTEAAERGLVQRVVPTEELEAVTRKTVATIARNAPLSLRYARIGARRASTARVDQEALRQMVADCFASEDYKEGVAAFLDKRDPVFTGK